MINILKDYFGKLGDKISGYLLDHVEAIMRCSTANSYGIARELCVMNKKSFKTNEMAVYRFLQNPKFQVDDKFWRCHIKLIFDMLHKNKIIEEGDEIQINVDFTTHEDNFLILSGSVLLDGKAITIYFTSRLYPKKKGQMSQKKMEEAFIKGLRHLLSKKYRYVIVADRGFGNQRFAELCRNSGFAYVLRLNSNLNIDDGSCVSNLNERKKSTKFSARVVAWDEVHHFTITTKEKEIWYLMSDVKELDAGSIYEKRFKIEKNFQDCKSSGYEIEKNKIRKYDRFKRMMYLVVLAHAITAVIGYIISKTQNCIKKNSLEREDINLKLILAFLKLDTKLFSSIISNPLLSSQNYLYQN